MDLIYEFINSMSSMRVILVTTSITIVGVVLGCLFSMRATRLLKTEKEQATRTDGNNTRDESHDVNERGEGEGEEEKYSGEEKKLKWSTGTSDVPSNKTMKSNTDPVDFCNHIQREVRKTEQRLAREELEQAMDEDDKKKEQNIQREQLQAIFKLMESQQDKFGLNSMDDINEQMKLYTN